MNARPCSICDEAHAKDAPCPPRRCPLCGERHPFEDRPPRELIRCDLCGDRIQGYSDWCLVTVEDVHASGYAHPACYALGDVAGFDRERIEAWLSVARECDAADAVRDLSPVEQARAAELWRRRQGVAA